MNKKLIRKMQTGAGGGFTSLITVPFLPNIKEIRHRLYNGINPSGYRHIPERIWDALNKKKANRSIYRDDQWATYLQIPEEERHSGVEKLQPARYRPSIGNTNGDVYRIPLNKEDADVLILRALLSGLGLGKNMVDRSLAHYLGDHTVGRGYDEKGEYISYYDKYDLNPFTGGTAIKTGVKEIDKWLKDNTSNIDMSMGIGKPFEIYDRIYLDDYYKVPKEARGATYLPEIIVTGKKKQGGKMNILEFLKNGSGIHIKKKNRGKFTSYCGGKVTDECILRGKNSSNPAIRKRATFAANARKWKHKDGGIIKALEGTNTSKWLKFGNTLNKVGNFMSNSGLGDFLLSGILTISSNNVADGNLLILNASLEMEKNEKKLMIPYYAKLLALLSLGPIDPENPNATKGVPADIAIPKFMSMLNGQIDQEYNNKKAINNMQTLLLKNLNTMNTLSGIGNVLMQGLGHVGLYMGNKLLTNVNNT